MGMDDHTVMTRAEYSLFSGHSGRFGLESTRAWRAARSELIQGIVQRADHEIDVFSLEYERGPEFEDVVEATFPANQDLALAHQLQQSKDLFRRWRA
jgi:hypothetical protein